MLYSAYGMNTNLDEMSFRCPTAKLVGVATLKGYRLQFRIHADIELDESSSIQVLLWDITNDDLTFLDYLEGYPVYYDRCIVPVVCNGNIYESLVYQMVDKSYTKPPHKSYLDTCCNGYEQNNMDLTQLENAFFDALYVK